MRIAVIHSFYRSAVSSGENNTVLAQVEALRGAGHEVKLIAQYTDENRKRNPLYPLKAGFDVATGNGYDPTPELEKFQPDVVRVHNLFPNFGTKWLEDWKGPVMATLHNYRPVCANGVLFRDGAVCTLCPDGQPLSALKYGCYKNSRLATAPLTLQISKGLLANPVTTRADKLVVLSKRSFEAYERFGIDSSRTVIIPDFVKSFEHARRHESEARSRWIVAARLSPEKGVSKLVDMWPIDELLDVFGAGQDFADIKATQAPNVFLRGKVDSEYLASLLPGYLGMVFPSHWWEGIPGIVLMAFQAGIPVVARAGSSGADVVAAWQAGLVYEGKGSLKEALVGVASRRDTYAANARRAFDLEFSVNKWLERTNDALRGLVASAA